MPVGIAVAVPRRHHRRPAEQPHLPAMRMAGQGQRSPRRRLVGEDVGLMRQQNDRRVVGHLPQGARQIVDPLELAEPDRERESGRRARRARTAGRPFTNRSDLFSRTVIPTSFSALATPRALSGVGVRRAAHATSHGCRARRGRRAGAERRQFPRPVAQRRSLGSGACAARDVIAAEQDDVRRPARSSRSTISAIRSSDMCGSPAWMSERKAMVTRKAGWPERQARGVDRRLQPVARLDAEGVAGQPVAPAERRPGPRGRGAASARRGLRIALRRSRQNSGGLVKQRRRPNRCMTGEPAFVFLRHGHRQRGHPAHLRRSRGDGAMRSG